MLSRSFAGYIRVRTQAMAGLLALLAIALWVAASAKLAKVLSPKSIPVALTATAIFFLPFFDEALGLGQYSYLCQRSAVKLHGTLPVGNELYSEDGEWRLGMNYPAERWREHLALVRLADSLVRWDHHGVYEPIHSLSPVDSRHSQFVDPKTERILAEWTSYSFKGGIVRRTLLGGSTQCRPEPFNQNGYVMYKQIMTYSKP